MVPATAWVRPGAMVTMSGFPQPDGGATVAPGSTATAVNAHCGAGASAVSLPGAGTWYLMLDSVATFTTVGQDRAILRLFGVAGRFRGVHPPILPHRATGPETVNCLGEARSHARKARVSRPADRALRTGR